MTTLLHRPSPMHLDCEGRPFRRCASCAYLKPGPPNGWWCIARFENGWQYAEVRDPDRHHCDKHATEAEVDERTERTARAAEEKAKAAGLT